MICPTTGRPLHRVGHPPPPAQDQHARLSSTARARIDLLGKTVGEKYLVRAVLGEGGMGTVFEAQHVALGRAVAVKVLHPKQMRKKESVRRFHQEARAAGAIGHPNICEVYDLGTLDDGRPYLVMERLVGETLADRIKLEGGIPFEDVTDILIQVLSGLVVAHAKGIVHRDIKPENVFLTERVGCPPLAKLLDFGVSKMISPIGPLRDGEDDTDLTRTGMVMGTPYYMSPEQARGERNLDARVDMYACGVLCYEMVTGRRPFLANNYNSLLLQIISTSPPPPSQFRGNLPPMLGGVIAKAMAHKREDRYQNAAEFQRDLQLLRRELAAIEAGRDGRGELRANAPYAPYRAEASEPATTRSTPDPLAARRAPPSLRPPLGKIPGGAGARASAP